MAQKEYVTARIPVEMLHKIDQHAVTQRRTRSQMILVLLESALALMDGKKKS